MCSEGGILFNKDKTQLIDYPAGRKDKSYTVPKGVIDISEAFYNCRYLSELIIPEGVEKVGGFAGSDNLHAITLPAKCKWFSWWSRI